MPPKTTPPGGIKLERESLKGLGSELQNFAFIRHSARQSHRKVGSVASLFSAARLTCAIAQDAATDPLSA